MNHSNNQISPIRRDLIIGHLAAAAVTAHILESALPGFGPWFKPGLANTFSLVAFIHLGWRAAAGVTLLRVIAGSLFLGTFLSPTFFLSLSGALGAVGMMGLIYHIPNRLGPVGISLMASLTHMGCQVVAAWFFIIGHNGIFMALPWFLVGSWFTGILNGVLAFLILEKMHRFESIGGRNEQR